MKYVGIFFFGFMSSLVWGQSTTYPLPKSAPKFSLNTKNVGPKPGSKASESAPDTAQFKRIYAKPARLRMLVRANCGTRIGDKALISRAQNSSLATGPIVQMDWERVRGESVLFFFVASMEREIVTIDLKKENGRYVSTNTKRDKVETWQIRPVTFAVAKGSTCVEEKRLSTRDMRVAAINFLNHATLKHFRKPLANY